eukprot:scaffold4365_cov147-Skeletonema_menzelii.AAC.11
MLSKLHAGKPHNPFSIDLNSSAFLRGKQRFKEVQAATDTYRTTTARRLLTLKCVDLYRRKHNTVRVRSQQFTNKQ